MDWWEYQTFCKNERKRNKVGKLSCKGLIMRMIINFVAEQVVHVFLLQLILYIYCSCIRVCLYECSYVCVYVDARIGHAFLLLRLTLKRQY